MTEGARPRPGSSRLSRLAAAGIAAAAMTACALPGADEPAARSPLDTSRGLPRELGERPAPLRPAEIPSPLPPTVFEEGAPEDTEDLDEEAGQGGGSSKGGGAGHVAVDEEIDPEDIYPPPPPGGQATSTTLVLHVADAAGDAGDEARYADGLGLAVDDTGARAVVTMDVGADLPDRLAEGEVMGIGVNVFLDPDQESDYQLFADGSSEGWVAYLDTPEGFVDYPGSFRLGTRRLVFDVPWRALGSPDTGRINGFADWSRRDAADLNPFSEDFLPDEGNRRFGRA